MNKKKLYDSIMESVSKELQNILLFNNSDIFNKEESLYDDSKIIDNYTYNNIIEKLKNAELVSEEEYEYAHRCKYKVDSKKELKEIIETYSIKNPIGSLNWIDTSLITDMSDLFKGFKYNGDISEWNTSNVTDMSGMFFYAHSFNQPIGNWDVSNVTDMTWMFNEASSFNQPIGDWDVSNVSNMARMFYLAISFNQPIGDWDVSNVINMNGMFELAISFNQPIGDWDVSNVIDMGGMFFKAESFNQPINNWNINNANMIFSFLESGIKKENMPKIKKIYETINFNSSDIFNKEDSLYDNSNIFDNYIYKNIVEKLKKAENVSKEEYEYIHRFKYKVKSKKELREIINTYSENNPTENLNWIDISNITDMSWLFNRRKYNGDISEWDTSNVTNMSHMFYDAKSFNQPIGNWDVHNVNNMRGMFCEALSFNLDISMWKINPNADTSTMFYRCNLKLDFRPY